MDELVAVIVTHIKCDAEECDYLTEDVSNETLHEYHNKPCPLCGENLLTDKDLAAFNSHILLEKALNEMLDNIGVDAAENKGDSFEANFKMATDGKGNTKIESINVNNGE